MSKPSPTRTYLGYRLSRLSVAFAAFVAVTGCGLTDTQPTDTRQTQASDGFEPSKLNAAHILIMHNESNRKPSHISRSRQEALQRANAVAARAKARDANFAALAKEYSDGPSAIQGGKLGNFQPHQMVKPFTDATKRLKIGEVSAPIETEFGYHVIKRHAVEVPR